MLLLVEIVGSLIAGQIYKLFHWGASITFRPSDTHGFGIESMVDANQDVRVILTVILDFLNMFPC